eukprot:1798209-Amphidinium_carterae.1
MGDINTRKGWRGLATARNCWMLSRQTHNRLESTQSSRAEDSWHPALRLHITSYPPSCPTEAVIACS